MEKLIYEEMDEFGYDANEPKLDSFTPLPPVGALPSQAMVNTNYLPPVGSQGQVGSCTAWASIYGMTTFMAASNGNWSPTTPDLQASPGYVYIKVRQQMDPGLQECGGTNIVTYVPFLANGGTPSLMTAPYVPDGSDALTDFAAFAAAKSSPGCTFLWSNYGSAQLPGDSDFQFNNYSTVDTTVTNAVKQVLTMGYPIAYGTKLYTDFGPYRGNPTPYIGNGDKHPGGHFMLIIGYDDDCNGTGIGAFLIQNSWSTQWGDQGLMWMAYDTFLALCQGTGYYNPVNS